MAFSASMRVPTISNNISRHYSNKRVFLSTNYRLIVAPRKFDVLKLTIMLLSRTSNFHGRYQSTPFVLIVHHLIFFRAPVQKTCWTIFNFILDEGCERQMWNLKKTKNHLYNLNMQRQRSILMEIRKISRRRWVTQFPATRIRIFLNPQLLLSAFKNFLVHTLSDSLGMYATLMRENGSCRHGKDSLVYKF